MERDRMSTTQPQPRPPAPETDPLTGKEKRNWWIWVSVGLALVLAGVAFWLVQTRSDLEAAQQEASDATTSYKAAYEELEDELGATQKDLASAQDDLEQAQRDAEAAEQEAADAREQADSADDEIDRATAQADAAEADAKAADAQATLVTDCANTFIDQVATVLQSADPAAAAEAAKTELQPIAADCREVIGRQ
jgi:chromosome segregation ATPase